MMNIMGIDIGTTTISMVMLETESGRLIGRRTIEHNSFCKGEFEESRIQDPEKIWNQTCHALQELMKEHGEPCGIGLTGQMHGMLYVDKEGKAVSPLYTWQDGSGNRILRDNKSCAQFLKENVGSAAAGFGLTTHYYLLQTGRVPKEAVKMTTISDYIAMRLTGNTEPVIAADMAASWGCFDLEKNRFYLEKLKSVGAEETYFPRVSSDYEIVGKTPEGIPVMCSMGDNQASVAGTVQSLDDTVLINVGTGSQVSIGISGYLECGGNIELRPAPPKDYIMVGSGLCGGRAYAMLEQFYREASGGREGHLYDLMAAQAEQFLKEYGKDKAWKIRTTFAGTRQDPAECGRIEKIRSESFCPGAMTVGMMIGILEELYGYYEEMCRLSGKRAQKMVGSGNGLRKNALMRRLAEEMFEMPMKIPAFQEEAACGAALYAMAAVKAVPSVAQAKQRISYLEEN